MTLEILMRESCDFGDIGKGGRKTDAYKNRINFKRGDAGAFGYGAGTVFCGQSPKWKENPCGDYEYTYQLNRMEHWAAMCAAYSLTGKQRYADKVLEELENWLDTVPCLPLFKADGTYNVEAFDECTGWRALEVGIRGFSAWPFLVEHLLDTPGFTEALFEKLLYSVYEHCRVLYEISPRLFPAANHNQYLMENLGLLIFSCIYCDLKDAEIWKAHAIRELERCMEQQVTPCGGQRGRSPRETISGTILPSSVSENRHREGRASARLF